MYHPDFWEQYAYVYRAVEVLSPYRALHEDVRAAIPPNSDLIVDAGCGVAYAARHYAAHQYIGLERSRAMLRARHDAAQCVQSDLCAPWTLRDCCADAVISVNVLYALPCANHMLREAYRVLKTGGTLVIVTPTRETRNYIIAAEALRETHQRWRTLLALMRITIANLQIIRKRHHFPNIPKIIAQLCTIGFSDIRTTCTYAKQNALIVATKGDCR